jgi:16S rRNA processing protein RimM
LTDYGPLTDQSGRRLKLRWVAAGIAEISEQAADKVVKIADREAAERLTNTQLFVDRDRLPAPEPDEYYLADLIGLPAFAPNGAALGVVSSVHDYGAGASLEVSGKAGGSFLVPFTAACVPEIDVQLRHLVVVPPDEIDGAEPGAASHERTVVAGTEVVVHDNERSEDDAATGPSGFGASEPAEKISASCSFGAEDAA